MSTADAFLTISDEAKKKFFLDAVKDSEELKRLRALCQQLFDALCEAERLCDWAIGKYNPDQMKMIAAAVTAAEEAGFVEDRFGLREKK